MTIRPQNSSQAQNSKTPNPNRKLIIQISEDEFVWDESSCSLQVGYSIGLRLIIDWQFFDIVLLEPQLWLEKVLASYIWFTYVWIIKGYQGVQQYEYNQRKV